MLGYDVPDMDALNRRKAEAQKRDDRRYELARAALVQLISGPRDYAMNTLPERALWLADNLLARIDGVEGCHDGDLQT